MSIFIFSKPIHSGKTTELQQWCAQQKNIAGILMPDIKGKRNILEIRSNKVFIIECADPVNTTEPLVTVGRYYFYALAFEKANSFLLNESGKLYEWLIIDEVGKLEMERKGFYPAVKEIIKTKGYQNLLLVVRDSLCEDVVSFFKISDHTIIHRLDEIKLI